jgi:hypothetical protein
MVCPTFLPFGPDAALDMLAQGFSARNLHLGDNIPGEENRLTFSRGRDWDRKKRNS